MNHSESNADVNASPSSPNSAATATNAAMPPSAATTAIVPLSNTQQVINLKLTNNNYVFWCMQMKPYLIGQGVFLFVDGSTPCPSSHASATSSCSMVLAWKQQDQLILSALLSSLSVEVLHLVVDCSTSASVWSTLECALASHLTLGSCNYMVLFKTFDKVMTLSLSIYNVQRVYLMSWLRLADLSLSQILIFMCFGGFTVIFVIWL